MGVLIYARIGRLTGPSKSRWPAVAAAVFFIVAPGPIAAHGLIADFAPVAECVFMLLTWFLWRAAEDTPKSGSLFFPWIPRSGSGCCDGSASRDLHLSRL